MSALKDLIGHIVFNVMVTDDEGAVRFACAGGVMIDYGCVGDCCSETWIAEVLNLSALIGHTVQNVEELELPISSSSEPDPRSRQEYDELYGYRLDTEAGSCTIVFRNSSNGCYGGWVERGVIKGNVRSIIGTDDWTAYQKETTP
jgi:hypothetical protein